MPKAKPGTKGKRARAAVKAAEAEIKPALGPVPDPAVGARLFLVSMARQAIELYQESGKQKIVELLEEAYHDDASDSGFATRMREKLKTPSYRRLLEEAIRAKLESLAPEATAPLALLLREYERTDSQPDGFFRGLCRVLEDLSRNELMELSEFVRALSGAVDRSGAELAAVVIRLVRTGTGVAIQKAVPGATGMFEPLGGLPTSRHMAGLLRLMDVHGLGQITPDAEPQWSVDGETLHRLCRILAP